ncbi:MAG TPA: hypothetical protein VMH35_06695 [Streptosporangiaceae bacterium]|nr:hypothetical protein [Streptosporangiaceae bacterium]
MTGAVIANWPLGLLVILVIIGVPLWLTFRRKHTRPGYQDAQNHSRLRKRVAQDGPAAALHTPDYVPAGRVNPLDGLTVPQHPEHGPAAGGRSGRPGRKPTPGDVETTSGE